MSMPSDEPLRLTIDEARGLVLAAQGLLRPPTAPPDTQALEEMVDRLGVVQIDTISVVERAQYLTLWSRLGAYDPARFDALLHPRRAVLECLCHAASIVPMREYPYHRVRMRRAASAIGSGDVLWGGDLAWMQANPDALRETVDALRVRGPLASSDFERPGGATRGGAWDWHGPKPSRRALEILWAIGDVMVHSRRGGQKVYDLRERVLAQAFGAAAPRDEDLPSASERRTYFVRRTVEALGLTAPSWLWDYYRLAPPDGGARTRRAAAQMALGELRDQGVVVEAAIEGLDEPVYLATALLPQLARLRDGEAPTHTTLLSPFDNLIWDRQRTRALFGYDVCLEIYVPPPKRRYGYYCLAILHRGRLVGRIDPKMDRARKRLLLQALHLEPSAAISDALLDDLVVSVRDLARFLGAETIAVGERGDAVFGAALAERLQP
jgi:uncharacterized protein YcaQ